MTRSNTRRRSAARPSDADAVILDAKLAPPPPRAEHVARRRLLRRLREPELRKLTLVAAPPGFGKSTFLAAFATAADGPVVAWLSLDEQDNDPARFLTYLAAAVDRVVPHAGDRALAALRSPGADLLGVVLPLFLNDLGRIGGDVVLVIEDYQLIANPDVHQALAFVVDRSPASLRLILSTREDPPLPLGRLRAVGALSEVRADDLRFSEEEAEAFLTGALGLRLEPDDVARLQARTEGWPAALYLAALSLRDRSDASAFIARFAGDDRFVVDYLTGEVLGRLSTEVRSFLLQTSILARFNGEACDAVTGSHDSAVRLAELERSNLLLVPLDSRRVWYRYHHLFGDLLRHELEATQPEAVRELHRRASRWYRDAGLVVDAASHAIAAGDAAALGELVARDYATFVDQGQVDTVIGWLQAIPDRAVADDWLLGFAGAVVYAHAGRFDDAERWLSAAEAAPAVPRNGREPGGSLAALAAYVRLLRGDLGTSVSLARRALAAPEAADPVWALAPQMVLAPALWWTGAIPEARDVQQAIDRTAIAAAIPAARAYSLGNQAGIALDLQDEAAATSLAGQAVDIVRESDLAEHPWTAMAWIVHGLVTARSGNLRAGAAEVEHGLALGERIRAWQAIAYASLTLAEVRHRQRESAAARRLLTRARETFLAIPDPGDGFARLDRAEKALKLRAARTSDSAVAPFWELSQREVEVLRLLPSQLSQREIAAELYISFNTIRTHTRVIFSKLGVTSRAEAVARARELGLV